MFIFNGTRHKMMGFIPIENIEIIAELGVFKGDNAQFLLDLFKPQHLYLIDAYDAEIIKTGYSPFDPLPEGVLPLSAFSFYFDGDPSVQATQDKIFEASFARFADDDSVTFYREDTLTATNKFADGSLDLIYIDANHQYEYVLQDMRLWHKKLSETGIIIMNDCISSPAGRKQNLGVLEAVTSFIKATDYEPIAISLHEWSDVIICHKDNPLKLQIEENLISSGVCTEIPNSLLPNFSLKMTVQNKKYFSFR